MPTGQAAGITCIQENKDSGIQELLGGHVQAGRMQEASIQQPAERCPAQLLGARVCGGGGVCA